MKIFAVVKRVLDDLYQTIEPTAQRDKLIRDELVKLRDGFKGLARRTTPIDYSKPETRFAYVFNYVSAHSNFVYLAFQELDRQVNIFQGKESIEITALGGGPGTDLLGALKYMSINDVGARLFINIIDREIGWAEQWRHIRKKVDGVDLPNVDLQYDAVDVDDEVTWRILKQLRNSDIYISSFFWSEIVRLGDKSEKFFAEIIRSMKSGSYFIVIDNCHEDFDGISELMHLEKLEEFYSFKGELRIKNIDDTDVDTEIQDYIKRFDFNAKNKQFNLMMNIYRKP